MIFLSKKFMSLLYTVHLWVYIVPAFAQVHKVDVCFTHIEEQGGTLQVGLYNRPEAFPKEDQEYQDAQIPVYGDSLCHRFFLSQGQYAIAVYHDVNNNGKVDRNLIGRPTEQYGFSNNVKPFLSAPKFKETAFWVRQDTVVVIRLF